MNEFTEAAYDFLLSLPGLRCKVLLYHRQYANPEKRAKALAEHRGELLLIQAGENVEPRVALLVDGWLNLAVKRTNCRRLADRLLAHYRPRQPRQCPAPSAN